MQRKCPILTRFLNDRPATEVHPFGDILTRRMKPDSTTLIAQAAIRALLQKTLAKARDRNPLYSCRSLARRLGISHSALSEILNAKRMISPKMGQKLLGKLNLSSEESGKILVLFKWERHRKRKLGRELRKGLRTPEKPAQTSTPRSHS